jgi:glycosyltransferase involved in cell wall biosynthesis
VRTLILNQYFPPDTSATAGMAAEAVTALTSAGHEVTVVAGRPSYQPSTKLPWRPLQTERCADLTVMRVGSASFDRRDMSGRLANYLSYGALCAPTALACRFDIVVSMSDPPFLGALALAIARWRRRPLVYWLQDFHPDFAVASGMLGEGFLVDRWRALHGLVLRGADRVVVLGEDMAERATRYGTDPKRLDVVRTGVAEQQPTDGDPRRHKVAQAIRHGCRFVVLYAGNLGSAGSWATLLAAAGAPVLADVGFVIVGSGAARERLERDAGALPNVWFEPFRPRSELPYVLAAGDLQVVMVAPGLEGLVVPSKLYGVLGAGRPVLAMARENSDVARLVRRHDCGLVVDPESPDALIGAVEWARRHPEALAQMGARAEAAARTLPRNEEMAKLVRIVEDVART